MTHYLKNEDHEKAIYDLLLNTSGHLYIASADLDNVTLCGDHIADILEQLSKKGVKVYIIYSSPSKFMAAFANEKEYFRRYSNIKVKYCYRNHMKMIVSDWKKVYFGSANITQAAIGNRKDGTRNFEVGIITDDRSVVNNAKDHFMEIWPQKICSSCAKFDRCQEMKQKRHDV